MEITKTVEIQQAWMPKEDAIVHFGFKNHEAVFQKLLAEFKTNPEFKKGYRLVTYKVLTINIELFDAFLDWKHDNKFR
ncbi:hypothetical protein [uncultured Enterococcus sp.]|uniref:hypothetical protein n=1 Tax=uncultured Enterococcus sp. TaxID=167972 RepID=UPI002AA916CF|nr:hypothetical protein [uncultured Enterococcus sp.]